MKKSIPLLGLFGVFCAVSSFSLANQEAIVTLGNDYHLCYTSSRSVDRASDVLDIRVYWKGTLVQTIEEVLPVEDPASAPVRPVIQARDMDQDGRMDFVVAPEGGEAQSPRSVFLFDPAREAFRRDTGAVTAAADN
ncbi:hypothetical protein IHV25_04100 [Phaeovibrio sulfidiphilus]|uniref:FG-GAP repeat protein n=1 Tax=Phaeovibrio sulfidiphilus TaxID=1220600 RepID=A0A8J6YYE8_9PROT|nr:hypothetical protein [Phaeovibrio sulfidiphilus]MBE1236833.1 hypothetical protein [Phaeovibrio sulfidiphilus]